LRAYALERFHKLCSRFWPQKNAEIAKMSVSLVFFAFFCGYSFIQFALNSGLTPRRLLAESSHNQNLKRNDFVLGGSIIDSRAKG